MDKPVVSSALAYEALKKLIFTRTLQPGEALSERGVAMLLSLSRTPVREAMRTLAAEGLLEIVPMRGAFVRRLSIEDLREIHEVRLAVEPMAAGLAARKGGSARLEVCAQRLRELLASDVLDIEAAQEAGWQFHDAMFEAAGNRRLSAIYATMRGESGLAMQQVANYDVDRTLCAIREHLAILSAISAGAADRAQALISEHLASALKARISTICGRI